MKCNATGNYLPSNHKIVKNIKNTCKKESYSDDVGMLLANLFAYMMRKNVCGCCHAFSSVLYVAFSELGYTPSLFIGECQRDGLEPFDHSWITIDNKIIDIAIYYLLTQEINLISGPVIFDRDVVSGKTVSTHYGINTGLPMSPSTLTVINTPFVTYMDKSPFEKDGLWGVLKKVYPKEIIIDENLKKKYSNVQRTFVR